jgi:ATP-dependent Lon protease
VSSGDRPVANTPEATPAGVLPDRLPVLPLRGAVVFPLMVTPLHVAQARSLRLVQDLGPGNRIIGLFAARGDGDDEPDPSHLYQVGTAANVVQLIPLQDGRVNLVVQGLKRIRLDETVQQDPYLIAGVHPLEDVITDTPETQALRRSALELFVELVRLSPLLPDALVAAAMNLDETGALADLIAAHLNLSLEERQSLLETLDVRARFRQVIVYLTREVELARIGQKVQAEIREEMDRGQREAFLRRQMEAIQRELGMADERSQELEELRRRIAAAAMPPDVQKEAEHEADRLAKLGPVAPESAMIRTYLDWLVSLPWGTETQDQVDLVEARRVLDEDHEDLDKVKERILEFLAVRALRPEAAGPILCFVGPPGVGKTSLGRSIARALGRRFTRLTLGGVHDEAEIRGHRRTYIGALPGRIIQALRRTGTRNPVMMLDELDKIGVDFRGDPSAALLEVLDPEQNHAFLDHYLDVPFDLSRVLFVGTANIMATIPPPLVDRLEVIEIPGYTEDQKLAIAAHHLVPRQLGEHGLTSAQLQIREEALRLVIREYTAEAGVRGLDRAIAAICRKAARRVAEGDRGTIIVGAGDVAELLGPPKVLHEVLEEHDEVGVVTGLAWTPVGGEVLFVEAVLVRGRGRLVLTGRLGEVMQESARAALTYVRSRAEVLRIDPAVFDQNDLHIHVPGGGIPKDGPSAGVAIATAIASAASRTPARRRVAMTGEITLRGRVLPVGGIREKLLAADRAGVETILLPRRNEKDLEDVPERIRQARRLVFVDHADEVLKEALPLLARPATADAVGAADGGTA